MAPELEPQVDETQPGAGGEPAAGTGSDATGGDDFSYDYEGEKYSRDKLNEAIEALRDRDAWNASYKQRDQREASIRDAIQSGFGKKMSEFTDRDLLDLKSIGLINSRISSDPRFAQAWEKALFEAYKATGATTQQAKEAVREDVAAAKAGEPAKLPDEVTSRLKRIDDFESMVVEQGLAQFENTLEGELKTAIDKVGGDLTGKFYPLLRSMVLQGLAGHSDVELLESFQSGALQREVLGLARDAAKTVRGFLADKNQATGAAVAAAKTGAAPAPTRGGVGERVDAVELKPGGGMSRFHEKFRVGLGR
jgi:hypothetical protein